MKESGSVLATLLTDMAGLPAPSGGGPALSIDMSDFGKILLGDGMESPPIMMFFFVVRECGA